MGCGVMKGLLCSSPSHCVALPSKDREQACFFFLMNLQACLFGSLIWASWDLCGRVFPVFFLACLLERAKLASLARQDSLLAPARSGQVKQLRSILPLLAVWMSILALPRYSILVIIKCYCSFLIFSKIINKYVPNFTWPSDIIFFSILQTSEPLSCSCSSPHSAFVLSHKSHRWHPGVH